MESPGGGKPAEETSSLDAESRTTNREKKSPWWKKKKWIGAILAVLVAIGVVVAIRAGLPIREYIEAFLEWTRGLGYWGPAALAGFYVIATVLLLPGAPVTMGAGLLFGLLWGTVSVIIGATLGACAAFLIARTVGRDWIADRIKDREDFRAIDDAVSREGFKIVLLIRLSPIFPFNLQNYAFGLTGVSFWGYAVASAIGMVPGILMYVYLGTVARSLAQIAAGEVEQTTMQQVFFWVGLLVTVGVVVYVTRVARRAVKRAMDEKYAEVPDSDST